MKYFKIALLAVTVSLVGLVIALDKKQLNEQNYEDEGLELDEIIVDEKI